MGVLIWKGVLCCLIGYLIGCFSPSYLFGRRKGYDVREDGSGNAGASNVFLLVGAKAFVLTALLDILKAFASWRIAALLFPELGFAGPLCGVACILGHMFPLLLHFRGGKGMACLGGVILAWDWRWFLLFLGLAVVIAFAARYVCLVAPTISVVFPICYYRQTGLLLSALILLLPAIPIIWKHRENFARIRAGTEMRTDFLWNKEKELRRIGKWDEDSRKKLARRGR